MLPLDPKKLPPRAGADLPGDPGQVVHAAPSELDPAHLLPAPVPAALSAPPGLTNLLHAFRRCWKMALLAGLLGAACAGGVAYVLVPVQYSAQILLRLSLRPPPGSLDGETDFASLQRTHTAYVKSAEVLGDALHRSNVAERFGVSWTVPSLQKSLVIDFNQGPDIMRVVFSGEHPEAAAALLNALGEAYPARIQQAEDARARERLAQLRPRLVVDPNRDPKLRPPTLAEQLQEKRRELREEERRTGVDDPATHNARYAAALVLLSDTRRGLSEVRRRRVSLEVELKTKQGRLRDLPAPEVTEIDIDDELRGSESYRKIQDALLGVEAEIEYLRGKVQPGVRAEMLQKPLREQADLERRIETLRRKAQTGLVARKKGRALEEAKRAISDVSDALDRTDQEEKKLLEEQTRLQIEVDNYRAGGPKVPLSVLALRDQERQLDKEVQRVGDEVANLEGSLPLASRVVRLTEAQVPAEKDLTKLLKFGGGASVAAFGLLCFGVCLLETRTRRIYGAEEVSTGLGLPLVGTLPLLPVAARGLAPAGPANLDAQVGMNEAVDALRTLLIHSPRLDGARVVLVTSAVGGEGKTTLATHLAASLARGWRKTLLIDADLRNPEAHQQFNLPAEPGFSEALRNEVEIDEVVRETPLSRLWLLPAGKGDAFALQALAQEGLAAVFERLKEQYDFIVIDTAPVLPVPDALVLGKYADAVLLSVLREVSRLPAVYAAQQRLQSLGIRMLGAVVIGEKSDLYGPARYPLARRS